MKYMGNKLLPNQSLLNHQVLIRKQISGNKYDNGSPIELIREKVQQ